VRKFQGAKVPGPICSGERKFQGARRPGSERAREPKFQGAKVPGSELARVLLPDSLQGANWPGSEKAVNLQPLPKYKPEINQFESESRRGSNFLV